MKSNNPINTPKVLILGGGFAGLNAAKDLAFSPAEITLIDQFNYHLFQPLLYQVATAGLSPADIAVPIRRILRNQKNVTVHLAEVQSIDAINRRVTTSAEILEFDFLVIATGAKYHYFNHPEWKVIAPPLKTIADATTIRRKILTAFEQAELEQTSELQKEWLNFVIIGGGPTGVELAGSLAELAHRALSLDFRRIHPNQATITLIEAGPRILNSFPESLSKRAEQSLKKMGVKILTNSRVQNINDSSVEILTQRGDKQQIKTRTILWAAGITSSPVGVWLNTETDSIGRVKVDSSLQVPGHTGIFVIGDAAHVLDENNNPLPGVAPVAVQQGQYVAKYLDSKLRQRKPISPFKYYDKGNMATIGRSSAVVDLGKIKLHGFIAWIVWLTIHIFYLIGFRNRLIVLIEWAWAYLTYDRGARLIVPPETIKNT